MKRVIGLLLAVGMVLCSVPLTAQASQLEIGGKSALLMEVETGRVLYEQNSHEKLAPASVTKVMTMLLIMEAIDSGALRYEDMVTASEAAAAKGGSQVYLKAGETMTVQDMLKSIAVSSANDCACAMAEHLAGSESAFVDKMNARAAELGMQDTHFVNCTGLDDEPNAKDHRTSAYDIALMSRQLMKYHKDIRKFTTIWMDTIRDGSFGLSNTNKMVRFYAGCTGLKTGFTSSAGYCLSATAEKEGMELIAVVMGCESSKQRFAACKGMLDYGFANFAVIRPDLQGSNQVPVVLGQAEFASAEPKEEPVLLIDKSQRSSVITETQLEPEVKAPVAAGERLGTLRIKAGEQVLAEIPLVAKEPVPRLQWREIFLLVLRNIGTAGKGDLHRS